MVHRDLIIALAAQYKLPAVYYRRLFVTSGGLISYGPDIVDQHERAASYVDRILKGEKAADLPVQAPTKYERVINLKTAKAVAVGHIRAHTSEAEEALKYLMEITPNELERAIQHAIRHLDLQPWFEAGLKKRLAEARKGDWYLRQRYEPGSDEEEFAILRHELGLNNSNE